jgi:lon-related putative ATP-dependent protease
MPKSLEVPIKSLSKKIDLSPFTFKTTADVPTLDSVIGQDRAVRSISFGLAMEDPSYNIFVTGIRGTGRTTIVNDLLHKAAVAKEKPNDWFYVYNFDDPDEPCSFSLPSRKAKTLLKNFNRVIANLHHALTAAFESEQYVERKNQLIESSQKKKREIFGKVEEEARKLNIQIKGSAAGFQTIPLVEGKPMSDTQYQKLSKEEREKVEQQIQTVQKMIQDMVSEAATLDRMTEEEVENLNQVTAQFIVESQFMDLRREFKEHEEILNYFNNVIDDIVQNVYSFLETKQQNSAPATVAKVPSEAQERKVDKYRINRVVDNSQLKGAPVIYEMNPTYNNLFGRIEKKSFMGYLYTDYTMIKAGSLLKANGGYIILDIEQILRQPFVYDALKRAVRTQSLMIEDVNELYGVMTSAGLKPKPIPLNVKVIIIGQQYVYHLLHSYDEEFKKIFKVRADFDYEVKESKSNLFKYIKFIARVVKEEDLRHFDRDAVQAVIQHAYRLVDHQKKLSIQFSEIVRLIREASYFAQNRHSEFVQIKDVHKAIAEEKYRSNLAEEKIQNAIEEKMLKFDIDGKKVGQINGLAVYDLGDYSFGKPSRITASTYIGNRGIINIEREAKLSGKIHDKGVLILSGYFAAGFGDTVPLSFSASITFEQSYGMIDGDSASCAELFALLSSLSGMPIYQGIAVTGSVNQKGEVQAIGGVNEKIEGFYQVCKLHRLNGKQGVIIPASNVQNLMLSEEIIEAVEKGKFHIWAITKIEEGILLLTGKEAGKKRRDGTFTPGSVFDGAQKKIIQFADSSKHFGKQGGKGKNNSGEEE